MVLLGHARLCNARRCNDLCGDVKFRDKYNTIVALSEGPKPCTLPTAVHSLLEGEMKQLRSGATSAPWVLMQHSRVFSLLLFRRGTAHMLAVKGVAGSVRSGRRDGLRRGRAGDQQM